MANKSIDFNSDVAQGFGVYKNEYEFELLDYMSSVGVACGAHAGDPLTIREALLKCKEKNVAIGANIGFFDIQGGGNRPMNLDANEVEALVVYQLGAISSFAKTFGLNIEFVRPHGAMYKMAYENYEFAISIAKAIKKYDRWMTYYGAFGDSINKVAEETGLVVAREFLLDKSYNQEGKIEWDSTLQLSEDILINRIRTITHSSQIKIANGAFLPVECDTVHFACKDKSSVELASRAVEILKPSPVNYNKVEVSGWV